MKQEEKQSFEEAVSKKFKEVDKNLKNINEKIKPQIKALDTENGKRVLLEGAITNKWLNLEYMNKVLGEIGLEIVEKTESSVIEHHQIDFEEGGQK